MKHVVLISPAALLLFCCTSGQPETPRHSDEPVTEVSTVCPVRGSIRHDIELLATTEYLRHWVVTAPFSAYVTAASVQKGQSVRASQSLFRLETKERQALSGDLMPGGYTGQMSVKAPQGGVITDVTAQPGCYVQEGEVLASMADPASLVFRIDVPYEHISRTRRGATCRITLPDGTSLNGRIGSALSTMTVSSQSVQVLARAEAPFLPEGMTVRVTLNDDNGGVRRWLLPRGAVQSDSRMTHFWVMKVGWNGRAERVDVTIGNSNGAMTEILSPALRPDESFITAGSYGLENDALIHVRQRNTTQDR